MKKIIFFFLIIFLQNCSKPKTVMICGDHKCINKDEAQQYFEENLSIEVKIIDNKKKNTFDLVELNLNQESENKEINIFSKLKTNQEIKVLTDSEIKTIKQNIKNNKKKQKIVKKDTIIIDSKNKKNETKDKYKISKNVYQKRINKSQNKIVDICTIVKKCSIDEISKYLLERGKKKDFPDITVRQ